MVVMNFDNYTDEQMDDYHDYLDGLWDHIKASNSRKTLAPMFIYLVLKEYSDDLHHLSNADIRKYLERNPYELTLERKAIARTLGVLFNEGVIFMDKTGSWVSDSCPNDLFERPRVKRYGRCA